MGSGDEMSERLRKFIVTFCNSSTESEYVAEMLHGEKSGAYYKDWLESELLDAYKSGALNDESATRLTGWAFDERQPLEEWLAEIWPMWFGKPLPFQSSHDDTSKSDFSQRLEDFMLSWCNPDSDPEEAAEMLHHPEATEYLEWLPQELLTAARSGKLTPETMKYLTGGLGFDDQDDVDRWLRKVWPMWFDMPFPGKR